MKISAANISLENQHQTVKAQFETRKRAPDLPSHNVTGSIDTLDIELESVNAARQTPQATQDVENKEEDNQLKQGTQLFILKLLIQKLAKREIEWFEADSITQQAKTPNIASPNSAEDPAQAPELVEITRYSAEQQSNALTMQGAITLESGQEINFAFKLAFEQTHVTYQRSVETVNMKDPLVISFTNKPVELTADKFNFDINGDGEQNTISHLAKGYGYLALDLNKNQQIDSGSELFGALSGNGFAELAQYDKDGNGFIDENDDIFSSLKVWVKNQEQDKLVSLDEANIGAIALDNVNTPFNLRAQGELQGAIRQSSFYLDNDGKAGLIQQVDFVV
jgi:hypothetical protein